MTVLFPCRGCPIREGCRQHQAVLDAVRPLKLGSVRFPCRILRAWLEPGDRVRATVKAIIGYVSYWDSEALAYGPAELTGTVIAWKWPKVVIWRDEWDDPSDDYDGQVTTHRPIISVAPGKIVKLEKAVALCPSCKAPAQGATPKDWHCHNKLCRMFDGDAHGAVELPIESRAHGWKV